MVRTNRRTLNRQFINDHFILLLNHPGLDGYEVRYDLRETPQRNTNVTRYTRPPFITNHKVILTGCGSYGYEMYSMVNVMGLELEPV